MNRLEQPVAVAERCFDAALANALGAHGSTAEVLRTIAQAFNRLAERYEPPPPAPIQPGPLLTHSGLAEVGLHLTVSPLGVARRVCRLWHETLSDPAFVLRCAARIGPLLRTTAARPPRQCTPLQGVQPSPRPATLLLLQQLMAWRERDLAADADPAESAAAVLEIQQKVTQLEAQQHFDGALGALFGSRRCRYMAASDSDALEWLAARTVFESGSFNEILGSAAFGSEGRGHARWHLVLDGGVGLVLSFESTITIEHNEQDVQADWTVRLQLTDECLCWLQLADQAGPNGPPPTAEAIHRMKQTFDQQAACEHPQLMAEGGMELGAEDEFRDRRNFDGAKPTMFGPAFDGINQSHLMQRTIELLERMGGLAQLEIKPSVQSILKYWHACTIGRGYSKELCRLSVYEEALSIFPSD